jgi:folylpolyglutamate synthase/dihydropteroate synthase
VIATHVDLPRALAAAALADRWRTLVPGTAVEVVDDVGAALDRALGTGSGPIVVAGSLYLVGEARRRWLPDPLLTDPEDAPA